MKLIALVTLLGAATQPISPGGEFEVKRQEDAQDLIDRGFAKAAPVVEKAELSKAEKKALADKAAADKAEADRLAAEQKAADKLAADKLAADLLAADPAAQAAQGEQGA